MVRLIGIRCYMPGSGRVWPTHYCQITHDFTVLHLNVIKVLFLVRLNYINLEWLLLVYKKVKINESTQSIFMHTRVWVCFYVIVSQKGWFWIQHIFGVERAFMEVGGWSGGGFPSEQSTTIHTVSGWRVNRVKRFMTNPKLCSFKTFAHLSSWQWATWPT